MVQVPGHSISDFKSVGAQDLGHWFFINRTDCQLWSSCSVGCFFLVVVQFWLGQAPGNLLLRFSQDMLVTVYVVNFSIIVLLLKIRGIVLARSILPHKLSIGMCCFRQCCTFIFSFVHTNAINKRQNILIVSIFVFFPSFFRIQSKL